MLQDFINKNFFFLFIFTFIFGLLLYGTIGFDSMDEICALLLLAFFIFGIFQSKGWYVNKAFIVTLSVFLFYLCYSFLIGSNVKSAIIQDFIIQFKPYLAFFATYFLYPLFSPKQKDILRIICLFFAAILLAIGLASLHNPYIINDLMFHRAYYAACAIAIALVFYFCSPDTATNKLLFVVLLSIGMFSTRSKFYGFFMLAVMLILLTPYIRNIRLNIKTILACMLVVALIIIVGWEKLDLYFAISGTEDEVESGLIARMMLYKTSIDVLIDYLPFGSGFGSFASYASGVHYSKLYYQYGLDSIWGINKTDYAYIADTFYPCLAQFGFVGIFLFFYFFWFLLRKSYLLFKKNQQTKYFIITLLIIGHILIESVADATFTSHRGFFMMMLLGISIAEQKQLNKNNFTS